MYMSITPSTSAGATSVNTAPPPASRGPAGNAPAGNAPALPSPPLLLPLLGSPALAAVLLGAGESGAAGTAVAVGLPTGAAPSAPSSPTQKRCSSSGSGPRRSASGRPSRVGLGLVVVGAVEVVGVELAAAGAATAAAAAAAEALRCAAAAATAATALASAVLALLLLLIAVAAGPVLPPLLLAATDFPPWVASPCWQRGAALWRPRAHSRLHLSLSLHVCACTSRECWQNAPGGRLQRMP